jgi:ubiquinone/menaquinone biosynthesis C-methylase UbiE
MNPAMTNAACYRTAKSVQTYSKLYLFRAERYLYGKYYRPGERVLDLACGSGRTTYYLHRMGCKAPALDLSEVLVRSGKTRHPELALSVGTFTAIPAANGVTEHVLISCNGLDMVHPEEERSTALRECARVLKPGGTLIFSSHNLKALHVSPYFFRSFKRAAWKVKNSFRAFSDATYLWDFGPLYAFYGSPGYVIRQTEAAGFRFVEMAGMMAIGNRTINSILSPYIHYVFRRS